jgi:hypothetical protein
VYWDNRSWVIMDNTLWRDVKPAAGCGRMICLISTLIYIKCLIHQHPTIIYIIICLLMHRRPRLCSIERVILCYCPTLVARAAMVASARVDIGLLKFHVASQVPRRKTNRESTICFFQKKNEGRIFRFFEWVQLAEKSSISPAQYIVYIR